jgi:hypothetical protein
MLIGQALNLMSWPIGIDTGCPQITGAIRASFKKNFSQKNPNSFLLRRYVRSDTENFLSSLTNLNTF